MTFLDTSVLIEMEKGYVSGSRVQWDLPNPAYASIVSVAELMVGWHTANSARLRRARREFLDPVIKQATVVPFADAEAEAYAQAAALVLRLGTPVGRADLMIAASAIAAGEPLLTLDVADFERIPGLIVRRFVPSEV